MPYTYPYPMPAVTVDAVILRKSLPHDEILLIKRLKEPFRGLWALPGGFVEIDEELDHAASRELREETGVLHTSLKQLFAVGTVGRDPRYRTISIVYSGWFDKDCMQVRAGDDAAEAQWFSGDELPVLAFDHAEVITRALAMIFKEDK